PSQGCIVRGVVMSDASDFLTKWVRKNITPTTAHIHNDTLTAGRLAEECLWEAQGENLSAAEVTDAAGGNLLNSVWHIQTNRACRKQVLTNFEFVHAALIPNGWRAEAQSSIGCRGGIKAKKARAWFIVNNFDRVVPLP